MMDTFSGQLRECAPDALHVHSYKTFNIYSEGGQDVRAARVSQGGVEVFHVFKEGDRLSQRERAVQFNVYIGGFPLDEVWLDGSRQAERVVHVEGGDAARFAKFIKMVIDHAFHALRDGMTSGGKGGKLVSPHYGLVGDIQ